MEDPDCILDALNDFEKKNCNDIPPRLEQLLCEIARTGEIRFPWIKIKKLFICKLELAIQEFVDCNPNEEIPVLPNVENVEFEEMKIRLLSSLETFSSAPFTIQRLCELVTHPHKYYTRSDKFMRGIEKNVIVVTTVRQCNRLTTTSEPKTNGTAMVNGIISEPVNSEPEFTPESDVDKQTCVENVGDNVSSTDSGPMEVANVGGIAAGESEENEMSDEAVPEVKEVCEDEKRMNEDSEKPLEESIPDTVGDGDNPDRTESTSNEPEHMQVTSSETDETTPSTPPTTTEETSVIKSSPDVEETSAIVSTTVSDSEECGAVDKESGDTSEALSRKHKDVEETDESDVCEPNAKRPRYAGEEMEKEEEEDRVSQSESNNPGGDQLDSQSESNNPGGDQLDSQSGSNNPGGDQLDSQSENTTIENKSDEIIDSESETIHSIVSQSDEHGMSDQSDELVKLGQSDEQGESGHSDEPCELSQSDDQGTSGQSDGQGELGQSDEKSEPGQLEESKEIEKESVEETKETDSKCDEQMTEQIIPDIKITASESAEDESIDEKIVDEPKLDCPAESEEPMDQS